MSNGAEVDLNGGGIRDIARLNMALQTLIPHSSAAVARAELAFRDGKSYGGDRDLYKALGYKEALSFDDFMGKFNRGDIAKTIVTAFPDATWRAKPVIRPTGQRNTPLEKEWKSLAKRLKFWDIAKRADILCGIGRYSVILLGFADGKDFSEPVTDPKGIEYLAVYSENNAEFTELVSNKNDPRYGKPLYYNIRRNDKEISRRVHPSRVIHIAEGALEDDIYGTPRLQPVFNRLADLNLIVSGSAEMFWRGAFPGYGFSADADAELSSTAISEMNDEIEDFVHNLKRYLRLQGVEIKEFKPQVASPVDHVLIQLQMISGCTRIPMRILIGSERGELASSIDESNWNSRVEERRELFAEPHIIDPFAQTMMDFGFLPKVDDYEAMWPDMETMNSKAKSELAQRYTKALTDYARTPGVELVMPVEIFLKKIMNLGDEEIEAVRELATQLNEWNEAIGEEHEGQQNNGPARQFDYDEEGEASRRVSNPRA